MFSLFSSPEKRFWKSIHENDASQIVALARGGMSVNAYGISESEVTWTPLHIAANAGREKIVEALLNLGAMVNVRDKDGDTPLHLASSFRRLIGGDRDHLVVKLLIDHGADVNAVNREGNSPLHLNSIIRGVPNDNSYAHSARLLVAHGADIHLKNNEAKTPLNLTFRSNRAEILEAIAVRGNIEDNNRILYWAVYRESQSIFELLLSKGADVNTTSGRERRTPLHWATENSRISMIDLLISKGAKVNACDEHGKTPLHLLVTSNTNEAGVSDAKPAVMERFIYHGANVNMKDKQGKTVLASLGGMAKRGGVWTQMGQILLKNGATT